MKKQSEDFKVYQFLNTQNPQYNESYFDDALGVDEEHRVAKMPIVKPVFKQSMIFENTFNYEGVDEETRIPCKTIKKSDNLSAQIA